MIIVVVIVDNIAVGCIYGHVEQKDNTTNKNNKTLVIDFICILKPYQKHGVGKLFKMNCLYCRFICFK